MSSAFTPVNPRPFLQSLIGKPVIARLKWGQEYKGMLVSTDSYMNIQLVNAEEFQDGNSAGELPGQLLIRCNNILYVREIKLGDDAMESDHQDDNREKSLAAHNHEDADAHMEDGEQGS